MKGYSWSKSDFRELLIAKYNAMDYTNYNGCLTLPQEFASATDFKAEETIDLDWSIKLPKHFSLWEWVYSTNYQWKYGSCTANSTSHWVQILNVKAKWIKPVNSNLITPNWKDLRKNMWHDIKDVNDRWDYVENAVSTAYKKWITNEEWGVSNIDGYATQTWSPDDKWIETIKRYIYNGQPIIWVLQWSDKITWSELTNWKLKTFIPVNERNGWHAIACVWWDEGGLWFLNSWRTNDWKGLKSRFYVAYDFLKKSGTMFNWRYWVPFKKEQAIQDPEYIKRKNIYKACIEALKKTYPNENPTMQKAIEEFSKVCRSEYPEINQELPLKS